MNRNEETACAIAFSAATIDVSPDISVELGGYEYQRLSNRVEAPLEANAVLFDDGNRRLYIIALDTLYVGRDVLDHIQAEIDARGGRPAEVLAAATHTHFAPMLDASKPRLGRTSAEYLGALKSRLSALIDTLDRAEQGGSARAYCCEAPFSINRRLPATQRTVNNRFRSAQQVFFAPNPAGYVDRRLRIRMIDGADGTPRAAIVHFACHPTSYPDMHAVTPDYIGAIREGIRKQCGADIPVVFLQGPAGDLRSSAMGKSGALSALRTLKSGPHFRPPSMEIWQAWRDQIQAFTEKLLEQSAAKRPLTGAIEIARDALLLDTARTHAPAGANIEIGCFKVGETINIVAMNAEPLSGWTKRLPPDVMLTGYVGDVFGYLPTEADASLGGYEVEGHGSWLEVPSLMWRQGFEDRIAAKIGSLLTQVHIPMAGAA
ncbi:MAG: hypothetical protein EON59_03665 [Alphaproteobacteria bacterium]|nr:MAG: hypothetical protein EON59_03665 [Alphaproteobacteria bacterium]